MKNKGIIPPRTIPKVIGLIVGSIMAAIKSATTCASAAPMMPAIYPLEAILMNRLMLQPE